MATSLGFSMASSVSCYSSSSRTLKRRSFRVLCNSPKVKLPPPDPKDPFIRRLDSWAKRDPEGIRNHQPQNSLPFLGPDIFPTNSAAAPAMPPEGSDYYGRRRRSPPPDLASLLYDRRIVYIGLPLVPAVTELVIIEIMYLRYLDPVAPIYIYLNCPGTTRRDGAIVGKDYAGFAIYDIMMSCKNEIHTVAIGSCVGHACLILAAGTKGKRAALPLASIKIQQPRMPSSGLMQASDCKIWADEICFLKDRQAQLLAKHTGNSEETIHKMMSRGTFHMDAVRAKEYGVIDKVLWHGGKEGGLTKGRVDQENRDGKFLL